MWALMTHPEQWRRGQLLIAPLTILEHCVPAAVAQGWIVLVRESDLLPPLEVPVQSNPRRCPDAAGHDRAT